MGKTMKMRWMARWRVRAASRKFWAVTAAAVLAGAVLLTVSGRANGPVPVRGHWAPIEAGAQAFELATDGRLAPARLVELPGVAAGTLADVRVAWGDNVVQGQSLVRIISPELDGQLRTAEAAALRGRLENRGVLAGEEPTEVINARRRVVTAQGTLQSARGRAADSQALYEKGFVSRLDKDAAKLEAENAQDQVTLAQEEVRAASLKYAPEQIRALGLEAENKAAELDQLRRRRQELQMVAPVAGVLLKPSTRGSAEQSAPRELVQGAKVSAGDAILAIGDTSSFQVQANCSEADLAWLDAGMPAQVTVALLPGRTFAARVVRLGSSVRSQNMPSGTNGAEFECEFAFPADGAVLSAQDRLRVRIGGSATVRVSHVSAARQAKIPLASVIWSPDGRAQVRWRATADAAPTEVPVRVVRTGIDDIQIAEALAGEVWVPAGADAAQAEPPLLSRLLGFDQ